MEGKEERGKERGMCVCVCVWEREREREREEKREGGGEREQKVEWVAQDNHSYTTYESKGDPAKDSIAKDGSNCSNSPNNHDEETNNNEQDWQLSNTLVVGDLKIGPIINLCESVYIMCVSMHMQVGCISLIHVCESEWICLQSPSNQSFY